MYRLDNSIKSSKIDRKAAFCFLVPLLSANISEATPGPQKASTVAQVSEAWVPVQQGGTQETPILFLCVLA